MRKTRVLITDADTPKALAIVRGLADRYEVWTASESRLALAAWSRHVRRHEIYGFDKPSQLPEWVLATCKQNDIPIVIPPEEASSLLLAPHREDFMKHGIRIAALPIEALRIAVDKTRTLEVAAGLDIPVPASAVPDDFDDVPGAAARLGYPVVIKPRSTQHWEGRGFVKTDGVSYASNESQLLPVLAGFDRRLPPPILQKFIPGNGIGVCMLLGPAGDVLAEFAHRRLRDYRPTGSGSVLRESIPMDPVLRDYSLRLLRAIGCRGVAMVEFRTDERTGGVYLMEVNGRFWGSLQLATDAGVNFPRLLVDSMLGQTTSAPSYRPGVVLRWWTGDLVRTLRVLKGKPAGFTGTFPSRLSALREFLGPQPSGTRNEILRRGDWGPPLIEPLCMMRKLIA